MTITDPIAVIDAAIATCRRFPEASNPYGEESGTCLYRDIKPGQEHRLCLVGQIITDWGWTEPEPGYVGGADTAADEYDWPISDQALVALADAQCIADSDRRPWGEIIDDLAGLRLEYVRSEA